VVKDAINIKKSNLNIKVPRFTKEQGFETTSARSELMKKICGKNTKPEMALRKALYSLGIRYRINFKKLKGSPDIVLGKYKVVIFVDGEFWHGYEWEAKKKRIKSNRAFWIPKIERNMQRDAETNEQLKSEGYNVLRFWEHEVSQNLNKCVEIIMDLINR
jgi:DNA mismatch endonuclease (patch repair protein)